MYLGCAMLFLLRMWLIVFVRVLLVVCSLFCCVLLCCVHRRLCVKILKGSSCKSWWVLFQSRGKTCFSRPHRNRRLNFKGSGQAFLPAYGNGVISQDGTGKVNGNTSIVWSWEQSIPLWSGGQRSVKPDLAGFCIWWIPWFVCTLCPVDALLVGNCVGPWCGLIAWS